MPLYRARWAFPGNQPPIENAIVELMDGRMQLVDDVDHAAVHDLGDVALVPALVNAHTHLEFSDLTQPLQPLTDFPAWIRSVVQSRREKTLSTAECIDRGLNEISQSQTSFVGEIATEDWRDRVETPSALKVVMFREFYGVTDERVAECLDEAKTFLQSSTTSSVIPALSPHAPYSVHPKLFRGLCDLARAFDVPLAFHLAETPAELNLIRDGSGPLAAAFKQSGFWRDGVFLKGTAPMDYLKQLAEVPKALVIHGNLLTSQEMEFLADCPTISVVYCPRTHAAMQQGEHPWRTMLDLGINVAIGTDSRASNPDLSVWNELRFLAEKHKDMPASEILKLATVNGSKALLARSNKKVLLAQGNKTALGDSCNGLVAVSLSERAINEPEAYLFEGTPLRRISN